MAIPRNVVDVLETTSLEIQDSVGDGSSPNTKISIDIDGPCERPAGRKAEKERQKRKAKVSTLGANRAVVESVDNFNVQFAEDRDYRRANRVRFDERMDELIKIKKDEMEAKVRSDEDAFICQDTTKMDIEQKQYYEETVREIKRKRRLSQNSGSSSVN